MRTEAEVKHKFDEVYARELRKKLEAYLTKASINCKFNGRYRVKGNGAIGFCHNPVVQMRLKRSIVVCTDGEMQAGCECYECRNTERSVEAEFREEIASPSICGQKYPRLAMLLWFLQKMPDESPRRGWLGKTISWLMTIKRAG